MNVWQGFTLKKGKWKLTVNVSYKKDSRIGGSHTEPQEDVDLDGRRVGSRKCKNWPKNGSVEKGLLSTESENKWHQLWQRSFWKSKTCKLFSFKQNFFASHNKSCTLCVYGSFCFKTKLRYVKSYGKLSSNI